MYIGDYMKKINDFDYYITRDGKVINAGKPETLLSEISNKVFEVKVDINSEYNVQSSKIANIRIGENEKIYRVVQDDIPEGFDYVNAKAGLEELYLYYFL